MCNQLICCGVQDEMDEDTGFTAEDIGDYFFDELDILGRSDVIARIMAATAPGATTADIATTTQSTLCQAITLPPIRH